MINHHGKQTNGVFNSEFKCSLTDELHFNEISIKPGVCCRQPQKSGTQKALNASTHWNKNVMCGSLAPSCCPLNCGVSLNPFTLFDKTVT